MSEVINPTEGDGFPEVEDLKGTDESFQEDIQKLAAENGMTAVAGDPPEAKAEQADEPEPEEDAQEPAETEETDQPPAETKSKRYDKFRDEEGNIDVEKVKKSTEAALSKAEEEQQALAQYEEAVRKMHSTSAQKREAETNVPEGDDISVLAQQFNDELSKPGADPGMILAKAVLAAGNYATKQAGQSAEQQIADLRLQARLNADKSELASIAKSAPWVLTKGGYEELSKIREEKPYLASWQDAYEVAEGRRARKALSGKVQSNPASRAVVTPASGARKVRSTKPKVDLSDRANLHKQLDSMSAEEERKFWQSQGVPGI